jgi:hypothetical protein
VSDAAVTHVGFSDESHWNRGRFRSLGLVTVPLTALTRLEQQLGTLLTDSNVSEFKWKELDDARHQLAAQKMCDFALKAACEHQLRVDVLIWDVQDRRHNIAGRDDIANLQRMYYHLFRNVLRVRWPDNAVWRLLPDEHTALDWDTVRDCLENVADRVEVECSLLTQGQFRIRLRRDFGLEEIRPVSSQRHRLLQLADLFAGMAVFSRDQFDAYQAWLAANSKQGRLFEDRQETTEPSRSSRARFRVLRHFDECCKQHTLGVSLRTKRGLWTPKPENPLNFWMYEPQHSKDKAPTKKHA